MAYVNAAISWKPIDGISVLVEVTGWSRWVSLGYWQVSFYRNNFCQPDWFNKVLYLVS